MAQDDPIKQLTPEDLAAAVGAPPASKGPDLYSLRGRLVGLEMRLTEAIDIVKQLRHELNQALPE